MASLANHNPTEVYDALVVGAGPGGSSAAYHLARLGRRVLLLERRRFPREKVCGDGLTRSSVTLLKEMGVLEELAGAQQIHGVTIHMYARDQREFLYPPGQVEPDYGLVVPRLELDQRICQAAVRAGAELWEESMVTHLLQEQGRVTGLELTRGGETLRLSARLVIAADGAGSHLARQAGLLAPGTDGFGTALRGYFNGLDGLSDRLEIYMPLFDPSDRYLLPSYGWVFPTAPGCANIGIGLFDPRAGISLKQLFERFMNELCQRDPRFANAQPVGSLRSAPLRFDFSPDRCWKPGLLLVGDAAGLVSPFTGEGIGYALESGKLAAECADRSLLMADGGALDLSEYAQRLAKAYVGYFETGRQSARRYQFTWHVLESTFHNDLPLFNLCRQAALFPEALGGPLGANLMPEVSAWIEESGLPLRSDLLAVGEILAGAVRQDWPFLAQAAAQQINQPGIQFRPALLLLLTGYLGQAERSTLARTAAALELGYLAALAQLSVEETPLLPTGSQTRQSANWGNKFALIVGDFLLSKAYDLSVQVGAYASQQISVALAQAAEGRVRDLRNAYRLDVTQADYLEIQTLRMATLFELPCTLGAWLGWPERPQPALAAYGRSLGLAYEISEELFSLEGSPAQTGARLEDDLHAGLYRLPLLCALQQPGKEAAHLREILEARCFSPAEVAEIARLVRDGGGASAAQEVAVRYVGQACQSLHALPEGPARKALEGLAHFVIQRADSSTTFTAAWQSRDAGI